MCDYREAWSGKCKNDDAQRCFTHQDKVCIVCGNTATHDCEETVWVVCGFPLCDDCEHRISPEGDNGGTAYLGKNGHCRKKEQKYLPWYMREDPEKPFSDMLKLLVEKWKRERGMV